MAVLDFASFSPPLSVRGASRLRSSLSVAEEVFLGSSPLSHSLPHLGASVSVSSFSHLEASLSVRSPTHFGSSVALYGLTSLGPLLPVSDFVSPSTFSLLQGCAHFNLLSLVYEEVHRCLCRRDHSPILVRQSRFSVLRRQVSSLAFRSLARCGLSLSVL